LNLKIKLLVTDVKSAFADLVHESSCLWLERQNAAEGKTKLQKMKLYAGYPVWLKNATALDQFYMGVGWFFC